MDARGALAPGPESLTVFRAGDLVGFATPDSTVTLLSRDGTVVRTGLATDLLGDGGLGLSWGWSVDPRDHTLVVLDHAPDGTPRSTFVAADGDPELDVTVDGNSVPITVDDGSVPGSAADPRHHPARLDVTYGRSPVVGRRARPLTTALVLRGASYVTTDPRGRGARRAVRSRALAQRRAGRAHALDPAHRRHPRPRSGRTHRHRRGVPALIAFDPASGTEVFRAPYPEGVWRSRHGRTLSAATT